MRRQGILGVTRVPQVLSRQYNGGALLHSLVQNVTGDKLTRPKYRADIDGLRAVAVLSVVAYHAFPNWVSGGFIGVDIFFVISGFLISSILFDNLQNNTFSFLEFYARRVRRIFPALVVVLSVSFIVGWFWLLPDEFQQLGKHTVGGAAFISNFMFLEESEHYFNNAAETKPLLHLWSLGVEEQFYIVWPLLLWWGWRQHWRRTTVTVPVLIISFVLNVALAHRHPALDFFSPITRFWELAIGALLADPKLNFASIRTQLAQFFSKTPAKRVHDIQSFIPVLGFLLIAIGLFVISPSFLYPFTWALLPTLGAALIIASPAHAWFNRTILANYVLVWFGLISYPLYLWHWPLLSFATILEADRPAPALRFALVILSVLLAWLTYIVVEKPIRFGKHRKFKTFGTLSAMLAAGSFGCIVFTMTGFPSRLKSPIAIDLMNYNFHDISSGRSEEEFWKNSCFNFNDGVDFFRQNGCEQREFPDRPTVFLVGDSYSGYLSLGLRPYLHEARLNLFQYSRTNCYTPALEKKERCVEIDAHVLKMIKEENPELVVSFDQYAPSPQIKDPYYYLPEFLRTARELEMSGARRIVFVGQMPNWEVELPKVLLRKFARWGSPVPERTYAGINRTSLEVDDILKRQHYSDNAAYLSLKDSLCNASGCLVRVGPDLSDDLIVWDRGHLTASGAAFVSNNILAKAIP